MTESEWLEGSDPHEMLLRARFRSHRRKSRLFAVACCRRIWDLLVDDRSRAAVEAAERHADGAVTDECLRVASGAAHDAHREMFDWVGKVGSTLEWAAAYAADPNPCFAAKNVTWMAAFPRGFEVRRTMPNEEDEIRLVPCTVTRAGGPSPPGGEGWHITPLAEVAPTGAEYHVQATLLRCLFGNPFRPASFDPTRLTHTVISLALAAYEERNLPSGELEPARLAVLSDALEEAGCDDNDILNHLRSEGPHVRGCWVVDLLVGKE